MAPGVYHQVKVVVDREALAANWPTGGRPRTAAAYLEQNHLYPLEPDTIEVALKPMQVIITAWVKDKQCANFELKGE